MKIVYIDESGTGGEPIGVMVGVVVDSLRMGVTKDNWNELLGELSLIAQKPIDELHTKDFYPGNGIWRGVGGEQRSKITDKICDWFTSRRHDLVFCVVDTQKYNTFKAAGKYPQEIGTLWRFMSMHLALAIQKEGQTRPKNKGNSILIMDNHEAEHQHITGIINAAPAWTDSFYNKSKKQKRLDQIIDVPYFADSRNVGLIQLADFFSYFIRRYIEIKESHSPEKYAGEAAKIDNLMSRIIARSFKKSFSYPKVNRCECAAFFYDVAPTSILSLNY